MKKLFDYADSYLKKCDWRDLALIKFCLFSIGIMAGLRIPERHRKNVMTAALAVFAVTYIPLMAKFFGVIVRFMCFLCIPIRSCVSDATAG